MVIIYVGLGQRYGRYVALAAGMRCGDGARIVLGCALSTLGAVGAGALLPRSLVIAG